MGKTHQKGSQRTKQAMITYADSVDIIDTREIIGMREEEMRVSRHRGGDTRTVKQPPQWSKALAPDWDHEEKLHWTEELPPGPVSSGQQELLRSTARDDLDKLRNQAEEMRKDDTQYSEPLKADIRPCDDRVDTSQGIKKMRKNAGCKCAIM